MMNPDYKEEYNEVNEIEYLEMQELLAWLAENEEV